MRDVASALEKRWQDFVAYRGGDDAYSAFVRLAEIGHCLRQLSLPPEKAVDLNTRIREVRLTGLDLEQIRLGAEKSIERLSRILSASGNLIYEEIVLVLTLRVELEILCEYLADLGIDKFPNSARVDDDLRDLAKHPRTINAYREARRSTRKNWGLPLRSKWLADDGSTN